MRSCGFTSLLVIATYTLYGPVSRCETPNHRDYEVSFPNEDPNNKIPFWARYPESGYDAEDPLSYDTRDPLISRKFDRRTSRSLMLLDESQQKELGVEPSPSDYVIGNFYHEGKFWIARVPKNGLGEAYSIFEEWTIPGGHMNTRFKMKPGSSITLIPQKKSERGPGKIKEVSEITFSTEALLPPGKRYSIFKGLKVASFGTVYRAFSRQTWLKKNEKSTSIKHVAEWKIHFDPAAGKSRSIEGAFERALHQPDSMDKNGYNTLSNSCVTSALKIIGSKEFGKIHPFPNPRPG